MLAPAGLAYAGSARDEAWAALTLLALDRKEAADPDYAGLPADQPRRGRALAILYRSPPGGVAQRGPGPVRRRGHLRQAGCRSRRGGARSHRAAVPAERVAGRGAAVRGGGRTRPDPWRAGA